jgi:hypothetical protein
MNKKSGKKIQQGPSALLTRKLERRLRRYRIVIVTLTALTVTLISFCGYMFIENYSEAIRLFTTPSEMPLRDEVMKITKPLKSSFLSTLMRPDVRISLDFENATWTIHNIREFDPEGNLLLEQGRYGRCGELSYHVYQKIGPLLEDKYTTELWLCAESKFFPFMIGDHIVVRITNNGLLTDNVYIIDPTYGRYGRLEDFDDYVFVKSSNLGLFLSQNTDDRLEVGVTTPVLLKKQYLISLGVVRVNGVFDSQNFGIALILSRPHRYISRAVAEVRKNKGETETGGFTKLPREIETREFYALRKRMIEFFEQITGESLPADVKQIRSLTQTAPSNRQGRKSK